MPEWIVSAQKKIQKPKLSDRLFFRKTASPSLSILEATDSVFVVDQRNIVEKAQTKESLNTQ